MLTHFGWFFVGLKYAYRFCFCAEIGWATNHTNRDRLNSSQWLIMIFFSYDETKSYLLRCLLFVNICTWKHYRVSWYNGIASARKSMTQYHWVDARNLLNFPSIGHDHLTVNWDPLTFEQSPNDREHSFFPLLRLNKIIKSYKNIAI